ncbi:hypothetical protein FH972_022651 [Carpinus fangiana]|uniref:Uncharacterized protein n=1 Tax=Carpinus fangiana TaxID=176857 RepID=A0A5N6KSV6_9ROSI|nr:hypothetical protein FH972_022651 [Carpinus fangiana]
MAKTKYSLFPAIDRWSMSRDRNDSTIALRRDSSAHRFSTSLRHRLSTISKLSVSRLSITEDFTLVHSYLAEMIDRPFPSLHLSTRMSMGPDDSSSINAPPSKTHRKASAEEDEGQESNTLWSNSNPSFETTTRATSSETSQSPQSGITSSPPTSWSSLPSSRTGQRSQDRPRQKAQIKRPSLVPTTVSTKPSSISSAKSSDALWPGWKDGAGGANRESIINDTSSSNMLVSSQRSEHMLVAKRILGITSKDPIMEATRGNDYGEIIRILEGKVARVDVTDNHGMTPLHWASQLGHVEACRTLLNHGASTSIRTKKCNYTALYMATRNGHTDIVKLLVEHRASSLHETCKVDNSSPLHAAALKGHVGCLIVLLDAGAFVNCIDCEGLTPLWWATLSQQVAAVSVLIQYGANLETRVRLDASLESSSPQGATVLWKAMTTHNSKLVRLLLENGADVNCAGVNGTLPMHWAAGKGNLVAVTMLLEYDAESESANDDGWTALHFAARYGQKRVGQLLIRCGANDKAKTKCGLTPAMLARNCGAGNLCCCGKGQWEGVLLGEEEGGGVGLGGEAAQVGGVGGVQLDELVGVGGVAEEGVGLAVREDDGVVLERCGVGGGQAVERGGFEDAGGCNLEGHGVVRGLAFDVAWVRSVLVLDVRADRFGKGCEGERGRGGCRDIIRIGGRRVVELDHIGVAEDVAGRQGQAAIQGCNFGSEAGLQKTK